MLVRDVDVIKCMLGFSTEVMAQALESQASERRLRAAAAAALAAEQHAEGGEGAGVVILLVWGLPFRPKPCTSCGSRTEASCR